MPDTALIDTALEVARLGSFSRAAERLELSTSSVSRQVGELEAWLGTPLFQRTTRRVSLTNAGEFFIERLGDISGDLEALRAEADALIATPRGRLRITAGVYFARRRVAPIIPAFLAMYPQVQIEFELTDTRANIVAEGIDLAIRVGNLPDSTLAARRIGEMRMILSASPDFIAKHGQPETIQQIIDFPCLVDTVSKFRNRWPIGEGLRVKAVLSADNGEMVRDLTLAGLGISFLPDFFVADDLISGRLKRVLPDVELPSHGIYALYPPRRQIGSTARAFTDFLISNGADNP